MTVLPLVLLLTLTAGTDRTVPPGCREDHGTCREDCTIDYGGGTTKYQQLNQCVARCNREQEACTTRFYSLRNTAGDLPSSPSSSSSEPARFEELPPGSSFQDTERRGVYRADEAPAPQEEPAAEEKPASAPPPAPAESEPATEPKPPAEVKKKSEPSRARGTQEEMRIFGDSDEEATEKSPEDAAPAPESPPAKPTEPKKKSPAKRALDEW
jgi:hypothetical protein